jgi:hypothetical protein
MIAYMRFGPPVSQRLVNNFERKKISKKDTTDHAKVKSA